MFLVGLTGGIATGKTTVSGMLLDLGCPVIDADKLARQVVSPGTKTLQKIRCRFGDQVINEDGSLNREAMAAIIFNDANKRAQLNSIIHPAIYKAMLYQIVVYLLKGEQFVILDLPLLFETGKLLPWLHMSVVVYCYQELQLKRLQDRNSYGKDEAMSRINSQMSVEEKCRRATLVIDNNGSLEELHSQVCDLHRRLRRSKAHWKLRVILGLVAMGIVSLAYVCVKRL